MAIIFKNPLIKIVLLKDAKKGNIRTSKTFLEQNLFYSYLTRRQRIHKLHEKKREKNTQIAESFPFIELLLKWILCFEYCYCFHYFLPKQGSSVILNIKNIKI